MATKQLRTIKISTGFNQQYLEDTLTTDITVLESIFDLIDNSIDAARDHILKGDLGVDKYGLPKDYANYKIHLRLGLKSICIRDNCLGINQKTLSERAFKIAESSNHKYGIGQYGLGLKRALLKFGSRFSMSTDDGLFSYKMSFSNKDLSSSSGINAIEYRTSNIRKTLFVASDLKPDVAFELEYEPWLDNALRMLAIRYAIYIEKGLKISVSCPHHKRYASISGSLPNIRKSSKLTPTNTSFLKDGVKVFIESGIHSEYIFPNEKGHSLTKNRDITEEYGLYFICNDRVIVAHSTEKEHGWKTKWHSEYNGFVCVVRFVSEDPRKMPWNTLKTALRTDGRLFMETRNKLQPIADAYRQEVKKNYLPQKIKSEHTNSPEGELSKPLNTKNDEQKALKKSSKSSIDKIPKPNDWKNLIPPGTPSADNRILQLLIEEGKELSCIALPCSSAVLFRSIIEKILQEYVYKTKNSQNVKNHFYESAEGKKKNHSDKYKNQQGFDISMILGWLKDPNTVQSIIPAEERKPLNLAIKKTADHIKKLNGVVHGNEFVDTSQINNIRNEILPLLEFCLKTMRQMTTEQS